MSRPGAESTAAYNYTHTHTQKERHVNVLGNLVERPFLHEKWHTHRLLRCIRRQYHMSVVIGLNV